MNKPIKFFALFITFLFFAVSAPVAALAAENTLGEESPYLYCVYYDANGDEVDGNTLAPGTYTVDVMLEGMQDISVFQYTAEYDPSVITELSTDAVIVEEKTDLSLGGIKTADAENGKKRVVLAMASTDESCTALDQGNAVTIASMSATVESSGEIDFEDYFDFVKDPDLTFIEADYSDGIEDAYVLDTTVSTTYAKYEMTADVTPENDLDPMITVSGKVVFADDVEGTATDYGIRGVTVYAYDDEQNVIAQTLTYSSEVYTAEEKAKFGDFTIEVPAGTTLFEVGTPSPGKDCIVNRPFTITGDEDVSGAVIPVITGDFNDGGFFDGTDKAELNDIMKNGYSIFVDYNNGGFMDGTDKAFFNNLFKTKTTLVYAEELHFN